MLVGGPWEAHTGEDRSDPFSQTAVALGCGRCLCQKLNSCLVQSSPRLGVPGRGSRARCGWPGGLSKPVPWGSGAPQQSHLCTRPSPRSFPSIAHGRWSSEAAQQRVGAPERLVKAKTIRAFPKRAAGHLAPVGGRAKDKMPSLMSLKSEGNSPSCLRWEGVDLLLAGSAELTPLCSEGGVMPCWGKSSEKLPVLCHLSWNQAGQYIKGKVPASLHFKGDMK